ncbi:holo-[acyl-carrier protein] synthase [Oceanospirillum multiglobuliferum]|uniref:Holo-[acyl-carrier-protein] synthase n=1 Tax=Oceanospirillum multiglobuliferum TaxID=64969 RepID=A0A1T4KL24_9GAMM|nr:holo-ACP synthase [Oceanospirillum multiglobuliferum]OPX56146.1 holo-ACP synthase [Oceanospirillum multiglobuliferum]SJZ43104.1 holo-[acyl-carrier protein] synthase [Oceanospirillum multiglobuliferum]
MILGIGTDLAVIERIETALSRHGERFAKRILTDAELAAFSQHPQPAAFLAKRFAAKEAAAKAIGTGIGAIGWHDLEVRRAESGAPQLVLLGRAAARYQQYRDLVCHLSITDEGGLAQAFVVLEARQ